MGYFITGSDTGVGKTLVSCALIHALAAKGKRVAGFKPVAAGCNADGQNDDALALQAASSLPLDYGQVNPVCLAQAIAPHIAAMRSGISINLERILASYRELECLADVIIVEGAGGFLVPLNEHQDTADLAKALNLPLIVVVGLRLGCLNHALLTLRAIADYRLECAGWIANVMVPDMEAMEENIEALSERITVPLLGVVPHMSAPDAMSALQYLNMDLLEHGYSNE